ncbi:hypothetical protein A3J02_03580 [Candidatus Azambacteria bacterium RIFCSPLOWO2_02_FULL_46_11]|uniref:Membrane insertase YidC/Oxa/ALB C-terminal domain-containing protein n=2 Tax=Candidatus Azamiibacteriota TaxID=1752741 RepID=A0A1F5BH56_9BACT|nr:MAG: hypothetical protein A2W60_03665 [Candidatus Azambacteria bacterium RIFCSPHIGHO2_02_46_12]OGD43110.1 MAG: hypothetical protein A3J02_03580 [Candidatus Azambacteria bacterium RIFCSPLOWO2_02_FULL_46_11]
MITLYNELLYKPLFNALIFIYNVLPGADMGLAIIFLTILIRLLLYPLSKKTVVSQMALKEIQPQILEIQRKYKDNKQEQAKATMALYQEKKINPFSGCLPILIQFPILIALYQVFLGGFDPANFKELYSFISTPSFVNHLFLGLVNLSQPNLIFAVLAGVSQFFQTRMVIPAKPAGAGPAGDKGAFSQMLNQQMLYFMPIFTIFIASRLPAALALYWTITNAFSIGQQYIFTKHAKKIN